VTGSTSRAIPAEFAPLTIREGPLEPLRLASDVRGSVDGILTPRARRDGAILQIG
jgi:hypothetical protein